LTWNCRIMAASPFCAIRARSAGGSDRTLRPLPALPGYGLPY